MQLPDPCLFHGEPSWSLESELVSLHVTRRGGHVLPVAFRFPSVAGTVSPYSLPPWQPAEAAAFEPVLQILRGDFFCFPFGSDAAAGYSLSHGETANCAWTLEAAHVGELRLALAFSEGSPLHGGRVEKRVLLRPGHAALYQEHRVSGVSGDFNYGHHPILHVPEGVEAELRTSPLRLLGVHAYPPDDGGERRALVGGARFDTPGAAPLARGGLTSLSRYPARPGHDDIVMLGAASQSGPAWTALTFSSGFVWVALRDAADFPSTLLWMSDAGRDAAPWKGLHARRIGVEDVCSHFCAGVEESRNSPLPAELSLSTCRRFQKDRPTVLRHVQFVAPVPKDFGGVARIDFAADGEAVTLHGESGAEVTVPLDWRFCLHAG
jgi:hypothetical protein